VLDASDTVSHDIVVLLCSNLKIVRYCFPLFTSIYRRHKLFALSFFLAPFPKSFTLLLYSSTFFVVVSFTAVLPLRHTRPTLEARSALFVPAQDCGATRLPTGRDCSASLNDGHPIMTLYARICSI
jgi:hypothetical protein